MSYLQRGRRLGSCSGRPPGNCRSDWRRPCSIPFGVRIHSWTARIRMLSTRSIHASRSRTCRTRATASGGAPRAAPTSTMPSPRRMLRAIPCPTESRRQLYEDRCIVRLSPKCRKVRIGLLFQIEVDLARYPRFELDAEAASLLPAVLLGHLLGLDGHLPGPGGDVLELVVPV